MTPKRVLATAARWRSRGALVAGVGVIALLSMACESVSLDEVTPEVGVNDVRTEDNRFSPRVVQVTPGTEITWEFVGNTNHNVIGDSWGSEIKDDGEFSHTFEVAGTFDYKCTLHGGMTGRVIVAP